VVVRETRGRSKPERAKDARHAQIRSTDSDEALLRPALSFGTFIPPFFLIVTL
jgi:hypothetical protein